jgi:gluconolactonase
MLQPSQSRAEASVPVDLKDQRMTAIIDPAAPLETLADGFQFTEGPIWHPARQDLRFSDIPANRLHVWQEERGVTLYREPSNMTNGSTYDGDGRMLCCEHATSRVVRERDDGSFAVLASHYDGKELNSPNDIVVSRAHGIYFTDPTYGRQAHTGVVRPPQLGFQGIYRIDASGVLHLLADDFEQPNGLCFNRDESVLYVADTVRRHIRWFDVSGDGSLSDGGVFAESPAPDGLKIDRDGNVYAGGPGGVYVYAADDGAWLGVIKTPAFCANFTWGGADLDQLFLTASTGLYRTRVNVPGRALF